MKFGNIPIFMRLSQMWQSMSEARSKKHRLDSIILMESLGTSEGIVQSPSKVERVPTRKVFEIYMQRDHRVESASIEV